MNLLLQVLFGVACVILGFAFGWIVKPQTKEVAGSVRGAHGRFTKRDPTG